MGKATSPSASRQAEDGYGGVAEPEHVYKFQAREPGELISICGETVLKRDSKQTMAAGRVFCSNSLFRKIDELF
jgi:hypothetical protein